jgi:release factor glutamine methyltransferase
VLVPRPETELLVEWALDALSSRRKPGSRVSVLDVGTGSGAIALAIASEDATTDVTALDISEAALAVARANAGRLHIGNVGFIRGDLFQALDAGLRRHDDGFDVIVSNPPYVADGDPHLADLAFEPALALTAGADGLAALRAIVAGAPTLLRAGGALLVEHGATQGAAVRALFAAAGFRDVETRRDLAGHERATGGRRA